MFIRYHVVGNAQAWNRQVVGSPGPVHAQGCTKQGKSRQWEQRGVWCSNQCSSGLSPYPASLHHCVRGSIQGVPYRLSMGAALHRLNYQCWVHVHGGTSGKVEDMEI